METSLHTPPQGTGTFASPVPDDGIVTSDYGWRELRTGRNFHHGLDFRAPENTRLSALDGGTVLFAGWSPQNFGNVVIIDHGNGVVTTTAHMNSVSVEQDDVISLGDEIGSSGNTGASQDPHVHLEVNVGGDIDSYREGYTRNRGGRAIDPEPYLPIEGGPEPESYLDRVAFQRGDNLPIIGQVQADLIAAGYPINEGVPTGFYGPETEAAVRQFQTDQGFTAREIDGVFGPQTRDALVGHLESLDPERTPSTGRVPAPESSAPLPSSSRAAVFSTDGPFATTAVGSLLGVRDGTPLGALNADQSYAFSRTVLGDSEGAAALEFLDRSLGSGDGVLVQRMVTMGLHEGQLHAGRENPDPVSGYNKGTFQLGGRDTTVETTRGNYEHLLDRGTRFLAGRGHMVDTGALTVADRDIITHIGYLTERADTAFVRDPIETDQLIREMGDADITGDALERLISDRVQGGYDRIGEDVRDWTDPETGLGVDLAVLDARQLEPDAVRREPAMPTLDRRLHPENYDTSRGPVTSPAVEQWQAILRAEGFLDAEPDGIYGDQTIRATREAQRAAGLEGDGVVGPDTWAAYSETLGQVIDETPTPSPQPPDETPAPEMEPLGDVAPEQYSVRQFDGVAAIGTWAPDAGQVAPSGDAARWVADTESPGNAGVQVTFPGALPDAELVARPGSTLDTLLASLAANGETTQIRTATQVLPDGRTSTGTYVLIDEATILEHYDSVDAYNADIRSSGALQTESKAPALDEARVTLAANPVTADLMDQVDGLVDNLLDTHTADPATAREALYDRAEADGGMTLESVREALAAQTPPVTSMSDMEARTLANGVAVGSELRQNHPDVAEARNQIRAAETPTADAPETATQDRQLDAPSVGGDGAVVGDGRGEPAVEVAPQPAPTGIER